MRTMRPCASVDRPPVAGLVALPFAQRTPARQRPAPAAAPTQHRPDPRRRPRLGRPSAYGQQKFRTPNIDRLAAEGTRFTQYYSGSTVCAPSRAALMTGLHTGHGRIRGNGEVPLRGRRRHDGRGAAGRRLSHRARRQVGTRLRGHDRACPSKQGFDETFGYLTHQQPHRQYTDRLWKNGAWIDGHLRRAISRNDLFTQAAVDFIEPARRAAVLPLSRVHRAARRTARARGGHRAVPRPVPGERRS